MKITEIKSERALDRLGIVRAESAKLCACSVKSRVNEKRGFSAALGYEVAELQNLTVYHKFNKFLFVRFHNRPPKNIKYLFDWY